MSPPHQYLIPPVALLSIATNAVAPTELSYERVALIGASY